MKRHLRMRLQSEGKSTFNSKKEGKKIPQNFWPITFFMLYYKPSIYEEILTCYNYETRNPTVYGNVIRGEVEYPKSSKKRGIDW